MVIGWILRISLGGAMLGAVSALVAETLGLQDLLNASRELLHSATQLGAICLIYERVFGVKN